MNIKRPRADDVCGEQTDDESECWICLSGASEGAPLRSFCACPPGARLAHRHCLRTFSIYRAGTELSICFRRAN